MQFSKLILVNSEKIKRPFKFFSPSTFICIRRLLLLYHVPGKSLAFNENKYQKHENAKRYRKNIKT